MIQFFYFQSSSHFFLFLYWVFYGYNQILKTIYNNLKTMDPRIQYCHEHQMRDGNFASWTSLKSEGLKNQNWREYFQRKIVQRTINNVDKKTLQKLFTTVFTSLETKKPLNFSVIFSSDMKKICGIKLNDQLADQLLEFRLEQPQNTLICVRELTKYFNQTGFSSEFKPFRLLSKNSTQSIYEATRNYDGARKIISAHPKSDKIYSNFSNQLAILRKINHPNIVCAQNIYQSSSAFYIVYSHSKQRSLKSWMIDRQGLSIDETIHTIQQVIKGLQYLHSKKIRHGNIDIDSIFVQEGKYPKIKIGNFKSSKILNEKGSQTMISESQERVTQTSLQKQLQPKIQLSDDIISLGMTILSMIKLQKLLMEKKQGSRTIKHFDCEEQPLEQIQLVAQMCPPLKIFLKSIFIQNKDKLDAMLLLKKEMAIEQLDSLEEQRQS